MNIGIIRRPKAFQTVIYTMLSMCVLLGALWWFWLVTHENWGKLGELLASCVAAFVVGLVLAQASKLTVELISMLNKDIKLWDLQHPSNCKVCISSLAYAAYIPNKIKRIFAPGAKRYAIGEGQIYALPYVISSLARAYGEEFDWGNFMHANEPGADKLISQEDADLIMIGGTYTNPCTRAALDKLSSKIQNVVIDNKKLAFRIASTHHDYTYVVSGDFKSPIPAKRADVGMILSCLVEDKKQKTRRRFVICAGCNTHATGGAAKYFCTKMANDPEWKNHRNCDYVAVVRCEYSLHPPVPVNLELQAFHTL